MPEAATIEAPPVTPPPAHPGAVTIDLGNLSRKPVPAVKPGIEVTPDPDKVKEVVPVETPPVVPPVTPKPNDKEHNLAELRKAREAAETARKALEEEHTKLKTEFEEFRKKPAELPEDVKTKLTKAEQLEKEAQELRQTIRQVDLARDPEFQAKYEKPIQSRISLMGQAAIAAGVSEADWKRVSGEWDRKQMAEWSESMDPLQKMQFNTAWMAAENLWQEQQTELKNADASYAALQKQRQADAEAQQKRYLSDNEQLAKTVMSEFIKPETLKEYEDLGPAAEAILMKAARHELTAKDIFTQLAGNQVLARVVPKQAERIKELEATLAERDKKISEQDAFIANQAGSVPRGDAAGASGPTGEKTPLWQNIVVKAPG
jgi:uncharacterized protein YoxC